MEGNGIMPVMNMGGNDAFSGSGIWLFAILALLWGGNSGGLFGGAGNANAIQADVNRGFDNQNLQAQTRDILTAVNSGTAQSVAATNATFHDTLAVLSDKYNEITRDIGGLAVGQANLLAKENECCCSTLRAIDGVNYNAAMNTAAINANVTANTQKILDAITGNRMADMQNQINQLSLAQALNGVVRYPASMAYNAGTSPFCNCGCGCNG